ncbi:sugar phosphate isomerase/epimerase family protein [Streptomyces sp. NPDC021093]|uniref:sugar phosphate isomerase/epimerase family protein n=1 Tax=Streptomyces sp. NPDC021093 TaxID=3365112 RepID=UPI0037A16413
MSAASTVPQKLCGIGDEAAGGLDDQVRIHRELGLTGLELRTVDGRWIHQWDGAAVDRAGVALRAAGLTVPVVDTPLGGWSTTVATPFADELKVLEVSAARALRLGCSRLRVMSYPNDGRGDPEWRRAALDRMRALAREAGLLGVTLLHENCHGWASRSTERVLRMLDHVASDHLRLLFDAGNGVWYGYEGADLVRQVLPHVDHVHIKDAVRGSDGEVAATEPGAGAAGLGDSIAYLTAHGYDGWYSVEPHLVHMPHLAVTGDSAALESSYRAYVSGLRAAWPRLAGQLEVRG